MARPKRSPVALVVDRAEMVKLMRRGYTQSTIAERFGVSQQQISKDWLNLHDEMKNEVKRDYVVVVNMRLEQLGEVLREAWEALEQSKSKVDKDGNEFSKPADPEYMRVILSTIDQMCDLEGVAVPKRKEVDDRGRDTERFLDDVLPVIKQAIDMINAKRLAEHVATTALPSSVHTVVQVPEAVQVEQQDVGAPMADDVEGFDLDEWNKRRTGGS